MPRRRSARIDQVKHLLAARLRDGLAQPGGRFLSARAVATRFGVSYQTAHRLLAELADEGLLRRKAASGSYLPGRPAVYRGVQLVFHRRARRKGSFGAHLLERLEERLRGRGVAIVRSWAEYDRAPPLRPACYAIVWECPAATRALAAARRFALVLNDQPPPGLAGSCVDAITTDDFSGGACAAELLKARTGRVRGFTVLAGPADDRRSQQRVAGFLSHAPGARVVWAESWFLEAGAKVAAAVVAARPAGIFTGNDRLAQALLKHAAAVRAPLPPLVGFDNAPIAERLGLTTVGIPWGTLVEQAVELVAQRLAGSVQPARSLSLPHEPVLRHTL